jgi:hypothetical protein
MAASDWAHEGAEVAEQKNGYTYTTVAKVTDTQIVLANGSRYRRSDMGKVGEKGPYYGYNGPTHLVPADQARMRQGNQIVAAVAREVEQVSRDNQDPVTALDKMQAVIDAARKRLTNLPHR